MADHVPGEWIKLEGGETIIGGQRQAAHVTGCDHLFSPIKGRDRWLAWCECGWVAGSSANIFGALRDRYDHLIETETFKP